MHFLNLFTFLLFYLGQKIAFLFGENIFPTALLPLVLKLKTQFHMLILWKMALLLLLADKLNDNVMKYENVLTSVPEPYLDPTGSVIGLLDSNLFYFIKE